jgi:hypothetical protein
LADTFQAENSPDSLLHGGALYRDGIIETHTGARSENES